MTPVRLEPAAPRSGVKRSTTEPLRSPCKELINPYYVSDFVCIMCTIVDWVPKIFLNDWLGLIQ